MSAPPGILAEAIAYIGVVVFAAGGLAYSFVKWLREASRTELPLKGQVKTGQAGSLQNRPTVSLRT
jgi:hypothetical protein